MTAHPKAPQPEFSHCVDVAHLPPAGHAFAASADGRERARVAQRLGITAVDSLAAEGRVRPVSGGMIEVTGRLTAEVEQACVVTLAPVKQHIAEDFSVAFTAEGPRGAVDPEEILSPDDDMPDVMAEGRIDVGEIMVEQLALALDPYPKAPGAVFDAERWQNGPETSEKGSADSPFAALASLKGKTGQGQ